MVAKRLRRVNVEKGMHGIADPPLLGSYDLGWHNEFDNNEFDNIVRKLIERKQNELAYGQAYGNEIYGQDYIKEGKRYAARNDENSIRTDADLIRQGFTW